MVRSVVILCVASCWCAAIAVSQDVRASARVDSNNVLIGKWVKLSIAVQHPQEVSVHIPSVIDSLVGFEIIKQDTVSTTLQFGTVTESTSFTITAFDSGTFVIPPFVIPYKRAGQSETVETSPIPIFVHGIPVDTSTGLKDIKPPLSLSITFAELLPYLIGIVVVGGVIWLAVYMMKKRKKGESFIPQAPPKPAHEVALEALRSLQSESLWQRGFVKEYHSQLTDIIRTYIERRFHILAMEMVTDEILASQEIRSLGKELQLQLREMLILADYVKFAKLQPTPAENEQGMSSARTFVESTWRIPVQSADRVVPESASV